MPIEIQCGSCGKRYRVDDKFAGKRVKCRNCAVPIAVPDVEGKPDDPLAALIPADAMEESLPASAGVGKQPLAKAQPAVDRTDDPEDGPREAASLPEGFGPALRAARRRSVVRQFRLINYPGSKLLFQLLPWIVGAVCLIPAVWQAVTYAQAGNPAWERITYVSVIGVLFLLLVIPVTNRGLRTAATMMNFSLPEAAGWRTLAIFSLPLVLGVTFFQQLELSGLIFGLAVGVLLVGPLLWIVFHLHWVEATVAWMMASLFFAGSVAVVAGVSLVTGLVITLSTSGSAPAPVPVVKKPSTQPVVVSIDSPTNQVQSTQPLETPATQPVVSSTQPGELAGFELLPPPPPPPTTQSNTPPPPPPVVENVKIEPSPVVASAKLVEWLTEIDAVLDAEGGPPLPLAMRKRSLQAEKIDVLDRQQDRVAGTVSFRRDPAASDRYIISPAGDVLIRIASWPKLQAQVWSTAGGQMTRAISVDERFGSAMPLGFASTDVIVLKRELAGKFGLETWNIRTGLRVRAMDTPPIVPNGVAISPDGKLIAVVAAGPPQVQLYESLSGRIVRRLPVTALDTRWPVEPVAVAFSPDASRLAIAFERDGNVLAVAWNTAIGKPLHEHVYPAGMIAIPPRTQFAGRALDWLDNDTWLLYGRSLIDTATGKPLGSLNVDGVTSQRIDGKMVFLEVTLPSGTRRMVRVTLDEPAIAQARQR